MILSECVQDRLHVVFVLIEVLRPDDDVVKVDMTDSSNIWSQRGEHATLVSAGGVPAFLRHDRPFILTEGGRDGRVFDMVGMHAGLEEGFSHVQFPPDLTMGAVGQNFLNAGQGVDVRDCVLVEDAVIVHPSGEGSRVRFWNKKARGSKRQRGRAEASS